MTVSRLCDTDQITNVLRRARSRYNVSLVEEFRGRQKADSWILNAEHFRLAGSCVI